MPPSLTVMAMRHAEKPTPDGKVGGVSIAGKPDPNELSVRGWQRAGALVPFFRDGGRAADGIRCPAHLFAPRPTRQYPSVRGRSTLVPLAGALDLPIRTEFSKDQVGPLVEQLLGLPGPVLVVWQHQFIVEVARTLVAGSVATPDRWPEGRFDMVWLLERSAGGWRFAQVPQRLLAGDSPDPL